jgi:hypothetical protein
MSRYEHSAALGWKADCEGGIAELIFGYGLSMEDLPNDMPPHIRAFIRQLIAVKPSLREVQKYLEKAVSEYDYREYDSEPLGGNDPDTQ